MVQRLAVVVRSLYPNGLAVVALALAVGASFPVRASEVLAREHNCLNCHHVDRKKIGPGFKQVAERYAKQKDAAPKLAEKIIRGGAGAWGAVAMPSNPVSNEEALVLARWVLATK
ncbi:MAG: cytochrome C' [Rubrivivax sp.]|nr:cytochrome C' [Rubrivivax sp.]